jgi:hypothetical protein
MLYMEPTDSLTCLHEPATGLLQFNVDCLLDCALCGGIPVFRVATAVVLLRDNRQWRLKTVCIMFVFELLLCAKTRILHA